MLQSEKLKTAEKSQMLWSQTFEASNAASYSQTLEITTFDGAILGKLAIISCKFSNHVTHLFQVNLSQSASMHSLSKKQTKIGNAVWPETNISH